jgi:hypothetical protein
MKDDCVNAVFWNYNCECGKTVFVKPLVKRS